MTSSTFRATRRQARRHLLQRLLPAAGFASAAAALDALGAVQIDPVRAVVPNHELVLLQRVRDYRVGDSQMLYSDHLVFEALAQARCMLPVTALGAFAWRFLRRREARRALHAAHQTGVRSVLDQLARQGQVQAREVAGRRVFGYWDNEVAKTKESTLALEFLWEEGVIGVSARTPAGRRFALMEDLYGERWARALAAGDTGTARDETAWHYIRAQALVDRRDTRLLWWEGPMAERHNWIGTRLEAGELVEVAVDGAARPYLTTPEQAQALRAAQDPSLEPTLLPPLDNLLWNRGRVRDLFDYDYRWQIYQPAAQRTRGAYGMPVVYGDRIIGEADVRWRRDEGVLEAVSAVLLRRETVAHLDKALRRLARRIGLRRVRRPPHGQITRLDAAREPE